LAVIHSEEVNFTFRIRSAACDFCGESLPTDPDARGFIHIQHDHDDPGRNWDACPGCITTIANRIERKAKHERKKN